MVTFDHASFDALRDEHLDLGDWPGDLVGWRLANPQRLPAPIPTRGRLGLFDLPDEVLNGAPVPQYPTPPEPPAPQGTEYDPDRPFELYVEPRDERSYALALYQWPVKANGVTLEARRVVALGGVKLQAVADHVLQALRRGGYKATNLFPRRQEPFHLDEETGLRLGLLFLTIAPLSRAEPTSQGLQFFRPVFGCFPARHFSLPSHLFDVSSYSIPLSAAVVLHCRTSRNRFGVQLKRTRSTVRTTRRVIALEGSCLKRRGSLSDCRGA